MKPTAVLINTPRGPVVNENDLYVVLRDHRIFAAGLDVFLSWPMRLFTLSWLRARSGSERPYALTNRLSS